MSWIEYIQEKGEDIFRVGRIIRVGTFGDYEKFY